MMSTSLLDYNCFYGRLIFCLSFMGGCASQAQVTDSSVDGGMPLDSGQPDRDLDVSMPYSEGGLPENFDGSVPALALGTQLACSLEANGEAYCWGADQVLSRVVPGFELRRANRMPGFRGLVQLSSPFSKLCGVDSLGDVWCMGINYADFLQVGSSEEIVTVARRRLDVRNMVQVLVEPTFLGRDQDGALFGHDTLPPRVHRVPLPAPGRAVGITGSGLFGYCVLLSSGRVACYPPMSGPAVFENGPVIVEGLEDITQVSVGSGHACALKRDGTVWCWGHNEFGQTGTPPESPDTCVTPHAAYYCIRTPRRVEGLNDVEELHAGGDMTCIRRRDRTLWCWGDNSSPSATSPGPGIIGDGLPNTELCIDPWGAERHCRRRPSRVQGLTNVAFFDMAKSGGGCARLLSGETWCWGYAGAVSSPTPVLIPFPDLSRDR